MHTNNRESNLTQSGTKNAPALARPSSFVPDSQTTANKTARPAAKKIHRGVTSANPENRDLEEKFRRYQEMGKKGTGTDGAYANLGVAEVIVF